MRTSTPTAERPHSQGGPPGAPRLAEGIELIGEYEGSGFKEPPSLVRRSDGQVVQLTNLLYLVADKADGRRGYEEIATAVGEAIGRQVSADNVRVLVEEKLRPLGVLAEADGSSPQARKLDPLLALKFRAAVIPAGLSRVVAAIFKPLFLPPVIVAVLVGLIAVDAWLFFDHGVAQGLRQTLYQPGIILLVFGGVVLSAAFHEFGHAAGCAYGGGEPGKMGCGLYLAWPAFYTDVTDAYRLGRRGRLRTDLGGVYFNGVFILATAGLYAVTGFEPLLLLIVAQHFEIAHQLLPVVRLDGYYIVADLTGVPDLFSRLRPILASMVPGRPVDERVKVLKPWVRVAVTLWVLVVVPLLVFQLFMLAAHLPRIVGTAWDSLGKQMDTMSKAFGSGDAVAGVAGVVQILALSLPVIGIVLIFVRLGHRTGRGVWRGTEGKPLLRTAALGAGTAGAVLLAMAWIPGENYEPIRKGERGTVPELAAAAERLPSGRAPLTSKERAAERGELGQADDGEAAPVEGADTTSSTTTTTATTMPGTAGDPATATTAPRSTSTTSDTATSSSSTSSTTSTTIVQTSPTTSGTP